MITDRELLELSAKAAGIDLKWKLGIHQITLPPACPYYDVGGLDEHWNPLTDDGDALRLAIDLEIGVMSKKERDPHERNVSVVVFDYAQRRIVERHGKDARSATRRAIVRAAAAIGENMK